jgi:hypothetical protein
MCDIEVIAASARCPRTTYLRTVSKAWASHAESVAGESRPPDLRRGTSLNVVVADTERSPPDGDSAGHRHHANILLRNTTGSSDEVFGEIAAALATAHSENLGRGDVDRDGTEAGDGGDVGSRRFSHLARPLRAWCG